MPLPPASRTTASGRVVFLAIGFPVLLPAAAPPLRPALRLMRARRACRSGARTTARRRTEWLPGEDSNLEMQDQNLLCYRYTTGYYVRVIHYRTLPASGRPARRSGPRRECTAALEAAGGRTPRPAMRISASPKAAPAALRTQNETEIIGRLGETVKRYFADGPAAPPKTRGAGPRAGAYPRLPAGRRPRPLAHAPGDRALDGAFAAAYNPANCLDG